MADSHTNILRRPKIYIFLALLTLSLPLALALTHFSNGLADFSTFTTALMGIPIVFLGCFAVATSITVLLLIKRLIQKPDSRIVLLFRYGILVWVSLGNLGFSLLFHNNSSFGDNLEVQITAGMYSFAVGLFFSILMTVGVSSDMERLIPENVFIKQKVRGGLTSKLFLSVTGVVAAFLIGAIGVTLMPLIAGLSVVQALPRILLVAVPFLLLTMILVFFLSQVMTRPLERSMEKINALGNKDLTQVLDIPSRDELGLLFINLNIFIEGLRSILQDGSSNAENNNQHSLQLDSLVEQEKELLSRINNEMNQISTSIKELSSNTNKTVEQINSMGSIAEDLGKSLAVQTESVEETSSAAEQMMASVKNIASISLSRKEASESLNSVTLDSQKNLAESRQAMDEVMKHLNNLSEINKVIGSVSARTNLLAMNAAIEAAHAGDAGKGFSVVAEEIRKLAESTSENSKSSTIFVKEMIQSIEESNQSLEAVSDSFTQVKGFSDDVVKGFEEIVFASEEMETSSNIIVDRMQKLKEHNTKVEKGNLEIQKSVEAVDNASQESRTRASSSQEEIEKILDHVKSLLDMALSIGESSSTLHQSALELKEQFDQFTLS